MSDSRRRILELDALRGLAALAVVLFHYTTKYDELYGRPTPLGFSFPWGQHGVDFLLMLSGYVIFLTLDRTPRTIDFVWRRFVRLYPVFWAAVGLTYLVVSLWGLPDQGVSLSEAALNFTMVPGLLDVRPVDGVYWSLQTELFFYAALLILKRSGCLRRLPLALGIWLAIAAAAQTLVALAAGEGAVVGIIRKLQTLLSLDYLHDFALGMLLYRWQQGERFRWAQACVAVGCIAFRWIFDGFLPAVILVVLAAILAAAVLGKLPLLKTRWLVLAGAISYPLYLAHQNIGYIVLDHAAARGLTPLAGIACAIAVALLLAGLLTFLVEQPALRSLAARRRSVHARSPAPVWRVSP
jgi:peptidoglycan/LPS O-acetylase OafA/YrhL